MIRVLLPYEEGNAISNPISVLPDFHITFTALGDIRDTDELYSWVCHIEKQVSNGEWALIDDMNPIKNNITIYGEGTYKVSRIFGKVIVEAAVGD